MDLLPSINHSIAMTMPLVILAVSFMYDVVKSFFDKRRKRREEQEKLIEMLTPKTNHGSPPITSELKKRNVSYNLKKGTSRYAVYKVN